MSLRSLLTVVFLLFLAGCAPAPVMHTDRPAVDVTPDAAARTPERYVDAGVIWGGMIIRTDNLSDHTEVTVIAYPLDSRQRPLDKAPTQGRFIIMLPGYVEAYDYPNAHYLTLSGRFLGTRVGEVEHAEYVFPLVEADHVHVWPENFRTEEPNVHFSIGVGVRIH